MAIAVNDAVPTFFGGSFVTVDESDATSADFQAPKKENRFCLVEMPKEQVEALEAGQLFHIKAHSGDTGAAALSTGENTFSLEFLENSNPMYLGSVAEETAENKARRLAREPDKETADKETAENKDPNSEGAVAGKEPDVPTKQCTIFAQCRGHLLLKPSFSDIQKVRDLLAPQSIDGQMPEGVTAASSSEPMTTSFLQYQVASSPKELKTMLDEGPYVQRDGVWSWMPAAFEREVTDISLNLVSLNGWDVACVDVKALLHAVQQHFGEDGARYVPSTDVLLNALRGLASAPTAEKPAEEGKLALDSEKINLFQATQLLRESPSRLRERFDLPAPNRAKRPKLGSATSVAGSSALQIEEFCAAFTSLTGKETTIEELCKIVGDRMYIDELDGAVHTLDVTTLPQDPRQRLKRLFELSSHWKPDRLASLIIPTVKGVKIDAWLLKFTKTVYIEFEKGKEVKMFIKKFAGL